jgi:hypothetical protein
LIGSSVVCSPRRFKTTTDSWASTENIDRRSRETP